MCVCVYCSDESPSHGPTAGTPLFPIPLSLPTKSSMSAPYIPYPLLPTLPTDIFHVFMYGALAKPKTFFFSFCVRLCVCVVGPKIIMYSVSSCLGLL